MKNIIILGLILIFAVNFGCNDNSVNKVIAQSELIPLKVNNYWIYKNTTIDSNNNIISTTYDTLKIIKDTILYSKTYYKTSETTCFNNNTWGVYEIFNPEFFNTEIKMYKYPCNLNDNYTVLDSVEVPSIEINKTDTVKANYIIFNIDTNIIVIAGTFSCIYYKPKSIDKFNNFTDYPTPFTPKTWISVNTGIIKMEFYDFPDRKYKYIKELVKYEIY